MEDVAKSYLATCFFGPTEENMGEFINGLQHAINHVPPYGIFAGDNLFTINRNLGFLYDAPFMAAFEKNILSDGSPDALVESSTIWRAHVLAWAAHSCLKLEGDFVECACYRGTSANILCDYLDFNNTGKHYYLYDLFEHKDTTNYMPSHGAGLYLWVKQRFSGYPTVHVTQGSVPEVLHEVSPEKIAFMHLDINNASAEIGALELLFDRIVPGGMIVLDDYGWLGFHEQKQAEDVFFAERGYRVLELPTGQGLLVK